MTAILNEDPPRSFTSRPNLPPGLQRVVNRCLSKSPEQRIQSCDGYGIRAGSPVGLEQRRCGCR